jgi:putative oxidoreductase
MKNKLIFAVLAGFSLHYIVFGANKFLLFANVPPPTDPQALAFLGGMFGSFLAKFVGATEIAGGLLTLFKRTRFVGLLVLLPVTASILAFHLAHDLPGNGIWIFTVVAHTILWVPYAKHLRGFFSVEPVAT